MSANLAAIDLHTYSMAILTWLGLGLLLGTVLTGVAWLAIKLLRRRVHPAAEALLWTVVLIKFLIPVGPAWTLALPASCALSVGTFDTLSVESNESGEEQHAPAPVPPAGVVAVVSSDSPELASDTGEVLPISVARVSHHFTWPMLGAGMYLLIVVALFAGRLRSYLRFRARCRALPWPAKSTRNLVQEVCDQLGVRRVPEVRISDCLPAPFVMGWFRPLLVLAPRQLADPDELHTVVVHEVAHLKRGDLLVRHLQWVVGTVFFFWPVVGWVNRRLDEVREHACDEWALRQGKLSAGAYARCLLAVLQPANRCRLAFHPVSLARNQSSIERRIDMILDSPKRPAHRHWGLLVCACLILGGGIALTGTSGAAVAAKADNVDWPPTAEGVKERAADLHRQVAAHTVADFDGDGSLTYTERDAYLIALALRNADSFLLEFPYADRNHSGRVDCLEAFGAIKGITRIAYMDRNLGAELDAVPDPESSEGQARQRELTAKYEAEGFRLLHEALNAQQWLLDNMLGEPDVGELDNLWSIVRRVEGRPDSYSARYLNHGGVDDRLNCRKGDRAPRARFAELESGIAALEAKLAVETDAKQAEKLRAMVAKLEAILAGLEES